MSCLFLKPRVVSVLMAPCIVDRLRIEAGRCRATAETGGILLGSIRGPHVDLVSYTTAGSGDVSRPFSFTRQDPKHPRAAKRMWDESGGTVTFLGEWHTHPSGAPTPSSVDLGGWKDLVRHTGLPMVFVVVAPSRWSVHLAVRHLLGIKVTALDLIEEGTGGSVYADGHVAATTACR